MTCPACGQEERQDGKTVLGTARPLAPHRECISGHAWHRRWRLSAEAVLVPEGDGWYSDIPVLGVAT
jgi:hypothetical protein